jgi:hypothetical protein
MNHQDRSPDVAERWGSRRAPGFRRIAIAVLVLVVLIGGVLVIDGLRRRGSAIQTGGEVTVPPGGIPIYVEGRLAAGFGLDDLEQLDKVSFEDAKEGKLQEGWLLSDVLLLYLQKGALTGAEIEVSSSSRDKAVRLTWDEVRDRGNMVMFDLSGRGTLKLVSLLERLDVRDEWIQDVDRIEVF